MNKKVLIITHDLDFLQSKGMLNNEVSLRMKNLLEKKNIMFQLHH